MPVSLFYFSSTVGWSACFFCILPSVRCHTVTGGTIIGPAWLSIEISQTVNQNRSSHFISWLPQVFDHIDEKLTQAQIQGKYCIFLFRKVNYVSVKIIKWNFYKIIHKLLNFLPWYRTLNATFHIDLWCSNLNVVLNQGVSSLLKIKYSRENEWFCLCNQNSEEVIDIAKEIWSFRYLSIFMSW